MSTFSCVFVNMCNYTFSEDSVVPIGQLSLATLINRKISEATASVIDLNYVYSSNKLQRSNDLQTMITESAQFIKGCIEPKLISLYTMCNTYHYAIMLAYELKRLCPTSTVCLAGPQASIVARETLESYPSIDFIAIGEGELTIESIIQGVKTDDYSSCKGIAYRKNDTVIVIPNDELLQNLDDLPFIDYDFLNFAPHDIISIEVGRGCPYSCIFCSTNDFWKRKYRIKSPARIFSEISYNSLKNKQYRDEKVRAYFLMLEAQGLCVTSYANTTRRFNQEICDFINTIHGDADSMVEPDPNNQQEMPVENSGVYMMNVDSLREYCEYYHPIILRYDKKAKVGFQHDCDVFNYGGSKGATYERVVIIPVSTTLPFIERQVKITSNQTRAKFYVACTRAKHSVVFAMENPCENGVFKATDIHFSDKSIPAYKFSKPDSDI